MTIGLREQGDAAHRELTMRHRVYPGLVRRGKMTQAEADAEIETMRAIRDTLRALAPFEDQIRAHLLELRRMAKLKAEADELREHPAVIAVQEAFPGAKIDAVRIIPGEF